jgi:hypothetical protein
MLLMQAEARLPPRAAAGAGALGVWQATMAAAWGVGEGVAAAPLVAGVVAALLVVALLQPAALAAVSQLGTTCLQADVQECSCSWVVSDGCC